MTDGKRTTADPQAGAYRIGDFFALLHGTDGCAAVEAGAGFWEDGIARLPPGRLISVFESAEDWAQWERHPEGEEFVLQLSGSLELIFERGDGHERIVLGPDDFAIVPRGVWHTANVRAPGRALYITPGGGSEHRART